MTIDTHAHWKPPALIEALRDRTESPRVIRNAEGQEVYTNPHGEQSLEKAFDNVEQRIAEMDRYGVGAAICTGGAM